MSFWDVEKRHEFRDTRCRELSRTSKVFERSQITNLCRNTDSDAGWSLAYVGRSASVYPRGKMRKP